MKPISHVSKADLLLPVEGGAALRVEIAAQVVPQPEEAPPVQPAQLERWSIGKAKTEYDPYADI